MRFSVVEYRPGTLDDSPEPAAPILLLAIEEDNGLRLFVDKKWPEFVEAPDHDYIARLIPDLKQRASFQPKELLQQLSSLNLHPLRTAASGEVPQASEWLSALRAQLGEL
jgi:hypothetical protein